MKQVLVDMVEELFDAAEKLNEKNFADLIVLSEKVKLEITFVKFGYEFGDDVIWDAGVIISPSPVFRHIYGSIKPTSNSEELDRILELALKYSREQGVVSAVYEALPDNTELVMTPSGIMRYAVKDLDKLEILELQEFTDYLAEVLETRVLGD